jgi:hypothetical protein
MSYNGIGLQTARGSGTNGHVTRNLSFVRHRKKFPTQKEREGRKPVIRKPNQAILEHERKRKIELRVLLYSEKLKERG